ncbi:alpha-glucoside transport [Fusarium agapanthi]|uniref:Alpha-glucoside transport n=1 Tax=Fusarium agapanthi TaxID=1803897 RepID=A0A9P5AWD3_9HYPO|nr:alpha-glucoside transport [Fusarium agapanthi]
MPIASLYSIHHQGTSYWDCFKTAGVRRTEIACASFLGRITCGAQFAYSATYFFQKAGLDSEASYNLNLGGTGMAFCGTIASWFLMRHIGRRNLYLAGMSAMSMWLLIIGALATNTFNPAVKQTGFFWFAFACLSVVWTFFRLPETKGRSCEELDLMFKAKLPTRKFKTYHVDAYDNSQGSGVMMV